MLPFGKLSKGWIELTINQGAGPEFQLTIKGIIIAFLIFKNNSYLCKINGIRRGQVSPLFYYWLIGYAGRKKSKRTG